MITPITLTYSQRITLLTLVELRKEGLSPMLPTSLTLNELEELSAALLNGEPTSITELKNEITKLKKEVLTLKQKFNPPLENHNFLLV